MFLSSKAIFQIFYIWRTLADNEKIVFNDRDVVKILNNFFSDVIKLFGISQNDCVAFVEEITDPSLKAILKYRCHTNILAIK